MRVDVIYPENDLIKEMTQLNLRMSGPDSPLANKVPQATPFEGLLLKEREADGDYYVYFYEQSTERIVAYFVFNRLVELNKRADKLLRSPHSKVLSMYRGKGLASYIYRYKLDQGLCFISGARQSIGADSIWNKLALEYPYFLVDTNNKRLKYLDLNTDLDRHDRHIRRVILGRGWDVDMFAEQVGLEDYRIKT